jgi:hypothetical protein
MPARCPGCGGPLCGHEEIVAGEFVLRSGETSNSYTMRCTLYADHDGVHRYG